MLIDTHAHLTWDSFNNDFSDVIKRANDAGVTIIINAGADLKSSKTASNLNCSPLVSYSSIGIHPEEISYLDGNKKIEQAVLELEQIYNKSPKKVIAVGECGLDYYRNPKFSTEPITREEKILQRKLFLAQINLAQKRL